VTAIDTAAFGALLREMDRATFARFVAAVFEARGRTVAVEGDRLRLGDGRLVAVRADTGDGPDGPEPPEETALLVTAGEPPTGTEALGPADLRERLLYGVDTDRRAAIAREFLGEPLVVDDAPEEPSDPDTGPSPDSSGTRTTGAPAAAAPAGATGASGTGTGTSTGTEDDPGSGPSADAGRAAGGRLRSLDRRVLVAVALVVLGAVGAGATVLAAGPAPSDAPAAGQVEDSFETDGERPGNAGDSASAAGADATGGATEVTPAGPGVSAGSRPPGVAANGSIDEDALAEAHTAALAGRSYRLVLTVRVSVDGQPVGLRRESIRVANATSYSADVTRVGSFPVDTPTLADGDVYANGSARVERIGPSAGRAVPVDTERPYADRVATYLRWYLSVEQSSVAEVVWRDAGGTDYWLTMRGDPWPGVTDTTGTALVATSGLVREVHRSYRSPDRPSVSAEVTLRVTDVGRTTVVPPAWYGTASDDGTAANATAGSASRG
jgi:hypothetical protein